MAAMWGNLGVLVVRVDIFQACATKVPIQIDKLEIMNIG
jgi:hypothetical protein